MLLPVSLQALISRKARGMYIYPQVFITIMNFSIHQNQPQQNSHISPSNLNLISIFRHVLRLLLLELEHLFSHLCSTLILLTCQAWKVQSQSAAERSLRPV